MLRFPAARLTALHQATYNPPGTLARLFILTSNYSPFHKAEPAVVHGVTLQLRLNCLRAGSERVRGARMILIHIWCIPTSRCQPRSGARNAQNVSCVSRCSVFLPPRPVENTWSGLFLGEIGTLCFHIKGKVDFLFQTVRHLISAATQNWDQMFILHYHNPICKGGTSVKPGEIPFIHTARTKGSDYQC